MTPSIAATRLVSANVHSENISSDDTSAALPTGQLLLGTLRASDYGLWEAQPGEGVDVEVDEIFLVLSGRGAVSFEDGSTIRLEPGVLVRLHSGDRTTWTISERLRKLYLA